MKNYQAPWLAASILAFSFAGCAGLNDAHYENTQKLRAFREYVSCGKPQCEKFPHDYKLGWLDGFYNIATGGPDCPPAVAPERYWNPKQVLKDCDNRRHSYYSGWQDGASRASQFPDTHHLKIFETCECPMPRCESQCGIGGCVPCGLGSVGSPVHAELIEMSIDESVMEPTPVVPPAPTSVDGENEYGKRMEVSDDSAAVTPAPSEQEFADNELQMLESESIEAESMASQASDDLVQKNNALSMFGSAPERNPSEKSTVRMQEKDPIDKLKSDAQLPNEQVAVKALTTETLEVTQSEPKILVPTPNIRKVDETSRRVVAKTQSSMKSAEPEAAVIMVQENIVPAASLPKQASEVAAAKPPKSIAEKELAVKTVEKATRATRHPPVATVTIPVRFEMIESDSAPVVQAK